VRHKFQMETLSKAMAYDSELLSGLDIARFYLKKFNSDSLIQLSEQGDFLSVKYSAGLNPALYTNEISIMSKILFSTGSGLNRA